MKINCWPQTYNHGSYLPVNFSLSRESPNFSPEEAENAQWS